VGSCGLLHAKGFCQVAGIDGHDFPITGHGCFVARPGDVGAFEGFLAEVVKRGTQSVPRWRGE